MKALVFVLKLSLFLPNVCVAQKPQVLYSFETNEGENSPLIADVNTDGHMDLLIASENNGSLDVWLGKGDTTLAHDKTYLVGDNPSSIAAADFNEDGRIDLVIANHERQQLSLLLGEANGRFGSKKQIEISVLPHPHVVSTADINSDGHMDIVVDSRDQSGLALHYGDGKGQFIRADSIIAVNGLPYLGFALGDINGNGKIDIITPNANSISVLSNTEQDGFIIKQSIEMPGVFAVEVIDINGDQNIDLIAASNDGTVRLYLGFGDGQFKIEPAGEIQLAEGAKLITAGDFNGNGIDDAVISNWNGGLHLLSYSNQRLNYQRLETAEVLAPWGISSGDLNGDGIAELVLTDGTGKNVNIYSQSK